MSTWEKTLCLVGLATVAPVFIIALGATLGAALMAKSDVTMSVGVSPGTVLLVWTSLASCAAFQESFNGRPMPVPLGITILLLLLVWSLVYLVIVRDMYLRHFRGLTRSIRWIAIVFLLGPVGVAVYLGRHGFTPRVLRFEAVASQATSCRSRVYYSAPRAGPTEPKTETP